MRNILLASAMLAASITGAVAVAEPEWIQPYNKAVQGISYDKAAEDGSYDRVTSIDPVTGVCLKEAKTHYSGSLGPLAEDVSVHLRGPVKLSRFAAYSSSSAPKLKRRSRHFHEHRRRAQVKRVAEEDQPQLKKRACGDWVTATYPGNGKLMSWQWTEGCAPPPPATAAPPPSAPVDIRTNVVAPANVDAKPTAAPVPAGNTGSGDWSQVGYYNAATKQDRGITFLNNKGADGLSGGWTQAMGNSLSYAAANGLVAAKQPTCLDDILLGSNEEITIMSNKKCGAQGTDCGIYRPDGVNYHGFSGEKRAFFFEFTMPDVPEDNGKFNGNMPAIWLLNAQIPRTQQYGGCSAWPGAGELDIAEALQPGERRLKATLHGNKKDGQGKGFNAGTDDYFERPVASSIIIGVVLADSKISIKVVDKNDFDFGAGSGAAAVDSVVKGSKVSIGDYTLADVY